jgi:hypothetical protein
LRGSAAASSFQSAPNQSLQTPRGTLVLLESLHRALREFFIFWGVVSVIPYQKFTAEFTSRFSGLGV